MSKRKPVPTATRHPAAAAGDASFHRSGAVARMLRMPVVTLRVWERRYGLTQPKLSPSGQRLYTADDVRRLALVKQLTDRGHAIGSLASLDMAQLRRVATTHAQVLAATRAGERFDASRSPPVRAWRLVVIGAALGTRLQRPGLLRRLGLPVSLLGPFDDVAQAAAALRGSGVDALLIHEPHLRGSWLAAIDAAAPAGQVAFRGEQTDYVEASSSRYGDSLLHVRASRVIGLGQFNEFAVSDTDFCRATSTKIG